MQSEKDSDRLKKGEPGSGAKAKRILIEVGILVAAVLAAYFLLRQLVFVRLAGGTSAFTLLALLVLFAWPGYVLFRRDAIIAQARRAEKSTNHTEVRMLRTVIAACKTC